jgi:hypothetical protein
MSPPSYPPYPSFRPCRPAAPTMAAVSRLCSIAAQQANTPSKGRSVEHRDQGQRDVVGFGR